MKGFARELLDATPNWALMTICLVLAAAGAFSLIFYISIRDRDESMTILMINTKPVAKYFTPDLFYDKFGLS